MGSESKYKQLDHELPEVVPEHDAPEVAPEQYEPPIHLAKATSHETPEALHKSTSHEHPEALYGDAHGKEPVEYLSQSRDSSAPFYASEHGGNGVQPDASAFERGEEKPKRPVRRYCGMRKRIAIIVFAVVCFVGLACIVIILAAVLTAVLPGGNSNGNALQAVDSTGLATVESGDTLYQYFQTSNGNIVENSYTNGAWSLQRNSDMDNVTVTTAAAAGSPLAAIAYPYNGEQYRQLFFITSTGLVQTTNRTETRSWSTPVSITGDSAANPGSIALAACWNNITDQAIYGLRVYYASQYGYIQEVGGYFNGSAWIDYYQFPNSDANSGVACTLHNSPQNQYLNVYYRDTVNGSVFQSFYEFRPGQPIGWGEGPNSGPGNEMLAGSDIAVCDDPYTTEYVFYQLESAEINVGILNPDSNYYEDFVQRQSASKGTRLAAAYVDGGALVAFQNGSSDSTMWVSDVSRAGVTVFNEAIL